MPAATDSEKRRAALLGTAMWGLAVMLPVAAIVVRGQSSVKAFWFSVGYLAPMCLLVPLWVRTRLTEWLPVWLRTAWLDIAVTLLAILRVTPYAGFFPVSGHMLFLTYTFLTTRQTSYRVLAAVIWVETTGIKWFVWHDFITWSGGVILGYVAMRQYRRWSSVGGTVVSRLHGYGGDSSST